MNATRILSAVALLSVLVSPLPAQKDFVDVRLGVEVKPPKGWTQLPGDRGHRGQCVACFAGPRALASKAGGTHTPTLRVLFFQKGLSDQNDEVEGLPRTTPFRDLDDYVKRGHGDLAKFTTREAGKFGDFEGRFYVVEVPVDRGPRRLIGASVPMDDGELVVEFEVLSEHADKEQKGYARTLDGLGKVERDTAAAGPTAAPWTKDPQAWKAMDAAARATARRAYAEAVAAAVDDAPGIGWKTYKSKYWTVVSAADSGFTKKAITAAEIGRAWCEQNLAGISDAEPLPAVLRIFASPDHYSTYRARLVDQREYSPDTRELYFVDDPNAGTSDGYGPLFRAVVWHWIDDHAPGSVQALPRWFDNGLWEYFRTTRLKGKKIEFSPGEVENGRLAYYRQKDQEPPAIWNLVQESMQPSPEGGANEDVWGYTPECARIMRWLFEHDGGAAFGKPTLVTEYVRALGEAYQAVGPNPTADIDTARLTDAQQKAMNQRFYTWRDATLKACNDRALPLSVDAWKVANDKWLKFVEESN